MTRGSTYSKMIHQFIVELFNKLNRLPLSTLSSFSWMFPLWVCWGSCVWQEWVMLWRSNKKVQPFWLRGSQGWWWGTNWATWFQDRGVYMQSLLDSTQDWVLNLSIQSDKCTCTWILSAFREILNSLTALKFQMSFWALKLQMSFWALKFQNSFRALKFQSNISALKYQTSFHSKVCRIWNIWAQNSSF